VSLTFGKRERDKVAAVLGEDYDSVTDASAAVLEAAAELLVARAKFTVVGQLMYSPDGGYVSPIDSKASKVCLGFYSTEGEAQKAAEALVYNTQTHEEFRTWVLPMYHGTPNDWYRERKEAHRAAEIAAKKAPVATAPQAA
jgi:hypothetical protein